ncbi:hypothetical protein P7L74_03515 (plasmid) [Tistrella mobilis]|uniref:hypothetical protein n=1 Tax=Tistrella mobilis TaxID=171437 RepID=UPI003557B713
MIVDLIWMSRSTLMPHIATIRHRNRHPRLDDCSGRPILPVGHLLRRHRQDHHSMISRQEAERRIFDRAARDPVFRHSLKIAPHATLEAMFGVDLPPDLEIEILQDDPQRVHIVLPENDMTDDALKALAARMSGWNQPG